MWMFPVELTYKICKMAMTTSNPFSIISVKKHTSTVRNISTTTNALPSRWDRYPFNIRIQSVFHPKVGTFFNDFDIFMTSPGRTVDIGQYQKGALYTRKYSACVLLPKIKISQIDPRILLIIARKVATFLGHFLH